MGKIFELEKIYSLKRAEIKKRLVEFKNLPEKNYFEELCFCLCTPQSSAKKCWAAVLGLKKKSLLKKGSAGKIAEVLKRNGVRFHNNKAKYIFEVRGKKLIYKREWLVQNIKGLGLKESSHFLRNIGLGFELAILDRHILKNLKKFKVIKKIPENLNEKNYLEIEKKFLKFSKKIGIQMAELDLLFWSLETGEVFK